jgi:arylsulfatase A-like enzyme
VRFLAARSPSTWTLPAHASLFSGLWPPQHGAERRMHTLAPGLETLAERFAAAGYRTAAVTDGVFLTPERHMDQGFESFVVHPRDHWELGKTLRAADEAVAEDDGRPLFLFVHTYRTHWPYRVGLDEDDGPARALRGRALRLQREALHAARQPDEPRDDDGDGARGRDLELFAPVVAELHELYREGARGLDAALGPWVAALEARGLFRDGVLVFTSDHGEEFLEHGGLLHGGEAHEELARVPLFIHGAGLAPRDVHLGASLVDLPPTLARLSGLAPDPAWGGRDLLALADERVLFSCARGGRGKGRVLAVTHGARKLHATGIPEVELPGGVRAAYDLAADPREQHDVRATAAWPDELARRAAPDWAAVLAPLATASELTLDAAELEALRELGYGE